MKGYIKITPEGLIAFNSDNTEDQEKHGKDENTREFSKEEYSLFGNQLKYAGNEQTSVTGKSLVDAKVSFKAYTEDELFNFAIELLRDKRDDILDKTEWTVNNDNALSENKKKEWITYRKKLRDITKDLKTSEDVEKVTMPTEPSK